MSAQIHGSLVFETSSVFCLSFDRGRVRRLISLSNVYASNVTPCHGQHVARELQVQQVCHRVYYKMEFLTRKVQITFSYKC